MNMRALGAFALSALVLLFTPQTSAAAGQATCTPQKMFAQIGFPTRAGGYQQFAVLARSAARVEPCITSVDVRGVPGRGGKDNADDFLERPKAYMDVITLLPGTSECLRHPEKLAEEALCRILREAPVIMVNHSNMILVFSKHSGFSLNAGGTFKERVSALRKMKRARTEPLFIGGTDPDGFLWATHLTLWGRSGVPVKYNMTYRFMGQVTKAVMTQRENERGRLDDEVHAGFVETRQYWSQRSRLERAGVTPACQVGYLDADGEAVTADFLGLPLCSRLFSEAFGIPADSLAMQAHKTLQGIYAMTAPLFARAGIPSEQLAMLRRAFEKALSDEEYLAAYDTLTSEKDAGGKPTGGLRPTYLSPSASQRVVERVLRGDVKEAYQSYVDDLGEEHIEGTIPDFLK